MKESYEIIKDDDALWFACKNNLSLNTNEYSENEIEQMKNASLMEDLKKNEKNTCKLNQIIMEIK